MTCRQQLVLLTLVFPLVWSGVHCGKQETKRTGAKTQPILIGLMMETYDLDRWKRDEMLFSERVRGLGADVMHAVAGGDQDRQNKQADAFLTQGVNALVVIPKNLKTAARIVRSAHERDIPVLAYDRLIMNSDLDVYVTFDNEKVGYLQAKGVLLSVPEGNFILLGGAASDNFFLLSSSQDRFSPNSPPGAQSGLIVAQIAVRM